MKKYNMKFSRRNIIFSVPQWKCPFFTMVFKHFLKAGKRIRSYNNNAKMSDLIVQHVVFFLVYSCTDTRDPLTKWVRLFSHAIENNRRLAKCRSMIAPRDVFNVTCRSSRIFPKGFRQALWYPDVVNYNSISKWHAPRNTRS